MPEPQKSIDPKYSLKSTENIGEHVTQIAIDGQSEYAVFTNSDPYDLAHLLRTIANQIERDQETAA